MKIAIVNQHVEEFLGGSESQCDNIAKELTCRGYEVVYVAPKGNLKDYRRTYRVIPTSFASKNISQAILNEQPDIVYWRFNLNHFYKTAKLIHKSKIPIIYAISNINDTKPWIIKISYSRGFLKFYESIKKIILRRVNYMGFRFVSGLTSLNPDYVNLVPVNKQMFIPNSVIREKITFSWPRPFIVWVANIKSQKRPELFLRLSKEFENKGVDFIMIGKLELYMKNVLMDKSNLPENFYYLGKKSIKEVNGILDRSLFLVHTCKPEGFGNVFIQAWLQRKPTISYEFDPGGYISRNKIGEVTYGDWELFVSKVEYYLTIHRNRIEAGNRAYDFAIRNFSISNTVDQLERFILYNLNT